MNLPKTVRFGWNFTTDFLADANSARSTPPCAFDIFLFTVRKQRAIESLECCCPRRCDTKNVPRLTRRSTVRSKQTQQNWTRKAIVCCAFGCRYNILADACVLLHFHSNFSNSSECILSLWKAHLFIFRITMLEPLSTIRHRKIKLFAHSI